MYSSIQFTATNSKWHHLLLISCPIKQCTIYMSLVVTFTLLESGAEKLLVWSRRRTSSCLISAKIFWGELLGVDTTPELTSVRVGRTPEEHVVARGEKLNGWTPSLESFVFTPLQREPVGDGRSSATRPARPAIPDGERTAAAATAGSEGEELLEVTKLPWRPYLCDRMCLRGADIASKEDWRQHCSDALRLFLGLGLVRLDRENPARPLEREVPVVKVLWRRRSRAVDLLKHLRKASRNLVEVRLYRIGLMAELR